MTAVLERTRIRCSTLLLVVCGLAGCQTPGISRSLTANQLSEKGIVVGSLARPRGATGVYSLFLRNTATGKIHLVSMDSRWIKDAGVSEDSDLEVKTFATALPPGQYEFFKWEVRGGTINSFGQPTQTVAWNNFEVPFTVVADEIQYFGRVTLMPRPVPADVIQQVAYAVIEKTQGDSLPNEPTMKIEDRSDQDLQVLWQELPDLPWEKTKKNVAAWRELQPKYDPLNAKLWRGALRDPRLFGTRM